MTYLCAMASKKKNSILHPSFSETEIIGINSGLVDYKLACHINDKLGIDLVRQSDLFVEDAIYSFYYYNDSENSPVFNLVSTVCFDKTLLDVSPRIDYMLIIRNDPMRQRIEDYKAKISEIEGVVFAFLMDSHKGKIVTTLMDIEQHEIMILGEIARKNTVAYAKEAIRKEEVFLGLRSADDAN